MEPNLCISTLQNELHGVGTKWFTLGVQLHIGIVTLKRIEQEWRADVTRCLLEVLIQWLKGNPSWNDIVKALRCSAMDEHSLADVIDRKYCNRDHRLSQSLPTSSPPAWNWNADSSREQSSVGAPQKGDNSTRHPIHQSTSVPARLKDAQQAGNRRMSMPVYLPESRNEAVGKYCYKPTSDFYVLMNKHEGATVIDSNIDSILQMSLQLRC